MVRRRGMPSIGELVVCKINRINPNSAFAILEEYGLEGMIHISEICYGWIRDIRKHVKIDQEVVAIVIRIEDDRISLSMKRVDTKKEKTRTKEYMMDQKAERMLEMVAGSLNKNLDQAYEDVGFPFQDNFGSITGGFKQVLKNAEALKGKIPDEWIEPIKEIAEKNIKQKEFVLKAKLILKSYKPDGINTIKGVLMEAAKMKLEIKYIAAPEYMIIYKTKQAKKGESEFMEKLEKLAKNAKNTYCLCEVEKC